MDKMKKEKSFFTVMLNFILNRIKKIFGFLLRVKEKVTYDMYKKQKEKNEHIGKKLKEHNEKIDEHKDKIYVLHEEINSKTRTIRNLEEQNRKQITKIKLLEKENKELKEKNAMLTERIDKI